MPRRAKLFIRPPSGVRLPLPLAFEVQWLAGGCGAPELLRFGVVLLMPRHATSLRRLTFLVAVFLLTTF